MKTHGANQNFSLNMRQFLVTFIQTTVDVVFFHPLGRPDYRRVVEDLCGALLNWETEIFMRVPFLRNRCLISMNKNFFIM